MKATENMIFKEHNDRYCLTSFTVFEDYEFVGNRREKKGKFVAKGVGKTVYNPLEPSYEYLILDHLVNLDWNDLDDVLQFYRDFGLLGQVTEKFSLREIQSWSTFPHQMTLHEEEAFDSAISVMELKKTLLFVRMMQKEHLNSQDKEQLLRESKAIDPSHKSLPNFVKILETQYDTSDEPTILKELISKQIRQNASFIESTQVYNSKYVYSVSFPSLIAVAYFQLRKALFQEKKFRRCLRKDCNKLFIPRHGHQKFCTPLPGIRKSRCENTHNLRLKREKKQSKQQLIELRATGMTYQAIANEIMVPKSTLISWAKENESEIKKMKEQLKNK